MFQLFQVNLMMVRNGVERCISIAMTDINNIRNKLFFNNIYSFYNYTFSLFWRALYMCT